MVSQKQSRVINFSHIFCDDSLKTCSVAYTIGTKELNFPKLALRSEV